MQYIILSFIVVFLSCAAEPEDQSPKEELDCDVQEVVPKGERIIGIDILDLTETNTFDQNILLAKELGIQFIGLHLPWNLIELESGEYVDPGNALELLSYFAEINDLKFSLTIRPIDIVGKTIPLDLEERRFNDPVLIDRFKAMLDFVFSVVNPSVLLNVQIGNEIDGYDLSSEPDTFWKDYGVFLNAVTLYIHSVDDNLPVGFTGTLKGLINNPETFNQLLENVDVLGVTYYPLNNDFSVGEPNRVYNDFALLTADYPNATIYLQEVGYQSSSENNSSEAKQAMFYSNLFDAWDQHSDAIKTINIVRLNDLSIEVAIRNAGPYGLSNNEFLEYLRTLGIRTFDNNGSNKEAFDVIKNCMSARGW